MTACSAEAHWNRWVGCSACSRGHRRRNMMPGIRVPRARAFVSSSDAGSLAAKSFSPHLRDLPAQSAPKLSTQQRALVYIFFDLSNCLHLIPPPR